LILILTAGCGASTRSYTHPEADMSYYVRVGVVPFKSLANDRFAGEKFAAEFITALLATEKFDVVDQGIFLNELATTVGTRSGVDGMTNDQLQKISAATGVQGVFLGLVSQYDMASYGGDRFPVITVEVRLVDTGTGTVVWKASVSERGGPKTPIIGVGEIHTLGELSQKLSKELVKTID
jgi:TolB-like protein